MTETIFQRKMPRSLAIQYDGSNWEHIKAVFSEACSEQYDTQVVNAIKTVKASNGTRWLSKGDWLAKELGGELFVYSAAEFLDKFEPWSGADAAQSPATKIE